MIVNNKLPLVRRIQHVFGIRLSQLGQLGINFTQTVPSGFIEVGTALPEISKDLVHVAPLQWTHGLPTGVMGGGLHRCPQRGTAQDGRKETDHLGQRCIVSIPQLSGIHHIVQVLDFAPCLAQGIPRILKSHEYIFISCIRSRYRFDPPEIRLSKSNCHIDIFSDPRRLKLRPANRGNLVDKGMF
ncbi:MAG: hypothetical protein BWY82_00778 [Verrucomicrobia bacterium ADurb.Bin474]|nr:MAG: hypothetical protein BWY82_00778 [Verrucomicrobia bacterium ADurb.Bin474]